VRPRGRLFASAAQDPFADLDDCAALLRDGDEAARRHDAARGVMPARERLEADDAAIHARLRLVMNIDLAARDREPQVLLQRALFAQLPVGLRLEETDRAARVLLRVLRSEER